MGRSMRGAMRACAAAAMLAATPAAAAPIEAYGRLPSVDHVVISPGGTRIALVVGDASTRQTQIRKTDNLSAIAGFDVGAHNVVGLQWADESNLLTIVAQTTVVPGLDGPRRMWWQAYDYNLDRRKLNLLLNSQSVDMNVIEGWPQPRTIGGKTTVFLRGISFVDGLGVLTLYRENPSDTFAALIWKGDRTTQDVAIDAGGTPVARVDYEQSTGHWSLYGRPKGGNWQALMRQTALIDTPDLEGFGRTEDTLIVGQDDDDGSHYHEIPVAGGALSPPIAALDGMGLIKDPVRDTVIGGVGYDGMALRYTFLDPKDQALWDRIVHAFPGETVRLASWSDDRSRILLRVEGPTNGAAYYRLDVKSHHADWIANEYAGIGADDLGEVRVIHYKAGDGREIPAYLTLPHGAQAKDLPLVLLVHGGPASRDDAGFDWWSQAIASLGYAVLQPQFRGSTSFGRGFLAAGFGEWGRKMQTDLSDGVRYLAAQGVVDPRRVCITGGSYGGYAAMAGVTLQSGIYKCAVAVAGVSDLRQMLAEDSERMGGSRNAALRFWQRFIGAKGMSDPLLDTLSPARHAAALDAPLLLIHGTLDTTVPIEQSRMMVAAARRAGKTVQLVTLAGEDHHLSRSDTRLQMLKAMADFLRTHLPPAPPASATNQTASAAP